MLVLHNRKNGRSIKRLVMFLLLLLIALYGIAYGLGSFLVINEPPKKADAIIVLSGGENRIQKGISLYKEHYAPYIILSNANEDYMEAYIIRDNIPKHSVLLETKADSTYKNALYTKDIMSKHHMKSAIVVTSNFHTRRTKMNFDKVYKDTGIQFTYVGVDTPGFNPHSWWINRSGTITVFDEYVKLIGNTFGIEGNESKGPLNKVNQYFLSL